MVRTGVHLLPGPSDTAASDLTIYVGEGDEDWARLHTHDSDPEKDWWTWVTLFVSKDDNLTKAHVRWLEARLIEEIRRARRTELTNGTTPIGGRLPEADAADMETFFETLRLLRPTLGATVFTVEAPGVREQQPPNELTLELRWEDAEAECVVREGQFVIKAGSTARVKEVDSLGQYMHERRRVLRNEQVLVPAPTNDQLLRFAVDYGFDSPSAAAATVSGTGLNGRTSWKVNGEGISSKEWQEKQVRESQQQAENLSTDL